MRGMQQSGVSLEFQTISLRVIFAVHLNLHLVVFTILVFARLCPCCEALSLDQEKKRQVVALLC